jgi:type IV pilus assembly protein PilW
VNQQRAFNATSGERVLQESARAALGELGTNLRRAGYGIDPWLAFDFGPLSATGYSRTSYQGGPPGGTRVACTGTGDLTCRDSVGGPDDLVFQARDPAFVRQLSAAPTAARLSFATALPAAFSPGQILEVMCSGGVAWAYVTVASTAADLLSVDLDATGTGIPYEQARLTTGCFATFATVRVFKVDRFHYYVQTFNDPLHPAGRPYLMLDRGLGGAEPVAPDVEDLQVAYVFRNGDVVGATASTQLSSGATSIDLASAPPKYDDLTAAASRLTHSPANIAAVRVSLVLRSPVHDPRLAGTAYTTLPAALNRPALTSGAAGYTRLLVETSEATRNLDSRGAFMPPYSIASGDGLNVGGG